MPKTSKQAVSILVAGEALIDFVPAEDGRTYQALPGGSPFNVAVGLARLDMSVGYVGTLSTDAFGRRLRGTLGAEGVCQAYVSEDPGPTTLAVVMPTSDAEPEYTFYGHRAADRQLRAEHLPTPMPSSVRTLHLGSYAMSCEPIGATLTEWMQHESDRRVISFDPNIRAPLIPDLDRYRARLDQWVGLSRIVKLSLADIRTLFPGMLPEALADRWLGRGRLRVLVITQGADGAIAITAHHTVHVPAAPVHVRDSVGAGDAFTAGLLAWLEQGGHLTPDELDTLSEDDVWSALRFAGAVAAMTCSKPGADPPCLDEVTAAIARSSVA